MYYGLCIMGIFFLAYYILHTLYSFPPNVLAVGTECQKDDSLNARAQGLISVGNNTNPVVGQFGNPLGTCALDPKAAFISYKLPTYEELESIYYTQSKSPAKKAPWTCPLGCDLLTSVPSVPPGQGFSGDGIWLAQGDLNWSNTGVMPGTGVQIIFVRGNLFFGGDFLYPSTGDSVSGIVFVVQGRVNIHQDLTALTAVIISSNTICTAHDGTTCSSSYFVSPVTFTISGSLISLGQFGPIQFKRSLGPGDASIPAEIIEHQSKYVVILRDLFSGSLQKWSEVAGVPYLPTPGPTSTPTPSPTAGPPTPTPSPTPALTYKRVFVGQNNNGGIMGGLSGANSICQQEAINAGLGGTWKAWLSDSTHSPANQSDGEVWTQYNGQYRLTDGTTVVATSWAGLTDGFISSLISRFATGPGPICSSCVYTNTTSTGNIKSTVPSQICNNWTSDTGSQTGPIMGSTNAGNSGWTEFNQPSLSCLSNWYIYCFEQ